MLRSVKSLEDYRVCATDGKIGSVQDFYFDDQRWTIRYLVVDAGRFFEDGRVLISPLSFREADWATRLFHLDLTMDKVKHSPSIDLDKPVSRQYELDYFKYYGWQYYWGLGGIWGNAAYPEALAAMPPAAALSNPAEPKGDPHLRSIREVTGYRIQGSDDDIGHVADFIVDDASWTIQYLVVDTSNWWFGKKVLVSPRWASEISWTEQRVHVALPRDVIKNSPEWRPDAPINREYEVRLYDYYGRPAYWVDEHTEPSQHAEPKQSGSEKRAAP